MLDDAISDFLGIDSNKFPKENPNILFLGYEFKSTALISFVTAFAFLCVAFFSPILSGIADFAGNKKRCFNVLLLQQCKNLSSITF